MENNIDDVLVKWFQERRRGAEIFMDDLTLLSGVSQGQISRIETGASKLTISTCVRLAYGLGVEFQEITSFLETPILAPPQLGSRECVDASDINAFLRYYREERREAMGVLEYFYDKIQNATLEDANDAYTWQSIADTIWRATEASPVELTPLPYPQNLNVDHLVEMFVSGATMTFQDVGVFIKKRRAQKHLSLRNMAEKINISYVAITRFEQGRLRRSSPSTLIGIGGELDYLDAFWGMAWAASEYDTNILFQRSLDGGFYPSDDLQRNLADTLMKISRWNYVIYLGGTDWIDELRRVLAPYYRS